MRIVMESLMDKGRLDSFKVRKGSEWPYMTETQILLSTPGGAVGVLDQRRQILIDGDFVQTDWEIPSTIITDEPRSLRRRTTEK